jgi:hypothetical protein
LRFDGAALLVEADQRERVAVWIFEVRENSTPKRRLLARSIEWSAAACRSYLMRFNRGTY